MVLIASYAPVGGGLMILCQMVVAPPCVLIVLGLLATSPARRRQPKYWIALACVAQPIPLAFLLREMGQFSDYFVPLWLASMGLVLFAFIILVAWADRSDHG